MQWNNTKTLVSKEEPDIFIVELRTHSIGHLGCSDFVVFEVMLWKNSPVQQVSKSGWPQKLMDVVLHLHPFESKNVPPGSRPFSAKATLQRAGAKIHAMYALSGGRKFAQMPQELRPDQFMEALLRVAADRRAVPVGARQSTVEAFRLLLDVYVEPKAFQSDMDGFRYFFSLACLTLNTHGLGDPGP